MATKAPTGYPTEADPFGGVFGNTELHVVKITHDHHATKLTVQIWKDAQMVGVGKVIPKEAPSLRTFGKLMLLHGLDPAPGDPKGPTTFLLHAGKWADHQETVRLQTRADAGEEEEDEDADLIADAAATVQAAESSDEEPADPSTAGAAALGPGTGKRADGTPYYYTDAGNAMRFADRYEDILSYAVFKTAKGIWRGYNGTHWEDVTAGQIVCRAIRLTELMLKEGQKKTGKAGDALVNHALASQSARGIRSMIDMSQGMMPSMVNDYDADHLLLNCENGTLDLRTGKLREHRREDLITKLIDASYDPAAQCPVWLAFLERVQPDPVMRAYLQRAAGYTLTGDTREEVVFFTHGGGRNGKSTFINTLKGILGPYACQGTVDSFMVKQGDGGINNDIAGYAGNRMIAITELDSGKRWSEASLKQLTSDEVRARFLHQEFFDYKPSYKLWFSGNAKPVIRGTDDGIWRRFHLIPFLVQIPEAEQDRQLFTKLRAERNGILNWLVEGCRLWLTEGKLPMPAPVKDATKEYRAEMDVLAAFVDECLVKAEAVDPNAKLAKNALYEVYKGWAESCNEYVLSQRVLSQRLIERGWEEGRLNTTRYWKRQALSQPDGPSSTALLSVRRPSGASFGFPTATPKQEVGLST